MKADATAGVEKKARKKSEACRKGNSIRKMSPTGNQFRNGIQNWVPGLDPASVSANRTCDFSTSRIRHSCSRVELSQEQSSFPHSEQISSESVIVVPAHAGSLCRNSRDGRSQKAVTSTNSPSLCKHHVTNGSRPSNTPVCAVSSGADP